jgi:hypothetical protein
VREGLSGAGDHAASFRESLGCAQAPLSQLIVDPEAEQR